MSDYWRSHVTPLFIYLFVYLSCYLDEGRGRKIFQPLFHRRGINMAHI